LRVSTQVGRPRATYDDIVALPDHLTGEIIDGELYTLPRPAGPHGIVATELTGDLSGPYGRGRGGPGGWLFIAEPELHLGGGGSLSGDVLVPDIAAWREPRLPFEARQQAHFTIVPDWVCEVLSPSTTHRDRAVKAPVYARHGVRHLWLVDPIAHNIDAHTLTEQGWLWIGSWGHDDARIPPFEAVGLELDAIWARVHGPIQAPETP
jgi:Uma2 family endonuclease